MANSNDRHTGELVAEVMYHKLVAQNSGLKAMPSILESESQRDLICTTHFAAETLELDK